MRKSSKGIDFEAVKDTEIDGVGIIKKAYNTALQEMVRLTPTKNLVAECGRGTGKTTHFSIERVVNVSFAMAGSTIILSAPTYAFILDTLLSAFSTYLREKYVRGMHYEIGKRPPKHFIMPDAEPERWQHTISFCWGTVIQFVSADRPESMIGKNGSHLVNDETLRTKEVDFAERILPALRSDRTKYGHSQYYGGMTLTTSTPNLENDHDWFMKFKPLANKFLLDEVKYASFRIGQAGGDKVKLLVDLEKLHHNGVMTGREVDNKRKKIAQLDKFITNYTKKLNAKLCEKDYWWNYVHASSYSNLAVLGQEYMDQQLSSVGTNVDKFNLSILGIRPASVKNRFFARYSAVKHTFSESYKYNFTDGYRGDGDNDGSIDAFSIGDGFRITSKDLLWCDDERPIIAGYDPGNFQSIVFGQEWLIGGETELRMFKNFWAYLPEEHHELAAKIDTFFQHHGKKVIYLHYDRAGNKHLQRYANNTKGKTDATILKRELEDLGWTVHLENPHQRTIMHWEHFALNSRLMVERDKLPRIRICANECMELDSSIQMTPRLPSDNDTIQMDKSAEKKLDYDMQVMYSPQIATAFTYMVWGLYSELKPEAESSFTDYEGL